MKTMLISLFISTAIILHAQEPVFNWANGMGGSSDDAGESLAIDALGNVYATGYFRDTVDFDPGPDTCYLISSGKGDIFIQKTNPKGEFIWAISIGGNEGDEGIKIGFNLSGNIVVGGRFWGTVDFDPGPDTAFLYGSDNHHEAFILEMDTSGAYIWAGAFLGSHPSTPTDFSFDAAGNRYTVGYFTGTVDFDPGPAVFELTAAGTQNWWDIFIQKMDSANNFVWAKQIEGDHDQYSTNIELDPNGNIIVNGSFAQLTDFDPGPGTYYLNSYTPWPYDFFLLKLDPNGNFRWAFSLGSTTADYGNALSVDPDGNIYSVGKFGDSIGFDPGPGEHYITATGWDIFIQKLDSSGNFLWAKSYADNPGTIVNGSAVDESGNIYSTGHYYGTIDFDPGPDVFELNPLGQWDIFIQKLDSSGDFCWAKGFGGKGFDNGNDIRINEDGAVYLTGHFEDTANFFNGYSGSTLVSNGLEDIFILKLDSCYLTYDTINPVACDYYLSPSGNHTWDSSGIYQDVIPNHMGCDSMITINLRIIKIDTSVLQYNISLFALDSNCTYQWADCDNTYSPIIGDTNQSFTPKENGSYAVILTKEICVDTSSCFQITSVSLNDHISGINPTIYPVPSGEHFTVDPGMKYHTARIMVMNMEGVVIFDKQYAENEKMEVHLKNEPPGIYLVNICLDDSSYDKKLMLL